MTSLNKYFSDPFLTRPSVLWLEMNLKISLFYKSVSSGSTVATASAPTSARSLVGSPGADVDCGLHRRHLEDGTCAGFVVDGCQVWFPPSMS